MAHASAPPVDVIGIDVGSSKTDLILVRADGSVLAAVRGETASHERVGMERAAAVVRELAGHAAATAGIDGEPLARVCAESAAGADLPADVRGLTAGLVSTGLATEVLVVNDCFGAFRAGTSRPWGAVVICGSGSNAAAIGRDGKIVRFDGFGPLSGDWGGGRDIGVAALGAAVRAEDGRGPVTSLQRAIPAHLGLRRPRAVTHGLARGRIVRSAVRELAPVVFEEAGRGDAIARSLVDRQADEIVAFAAAALRRARLMRSETDVVLAGGIINATDPAFHARIDAGIGRVAPRATIRRVTLRPVVGAALLGFDRLHDGHTPPDVEARLRCELAAATFLTPGT